MQGITIRGVGAARHRRARGVVAAALTVALAATIGLASPPQRAFAADYPSWQDVQNAIAGVRNNQALQTQLQAQVQQLQAAAAAAQDVARQKGDAYARAQDAADQQQLAVQDLQARVDKATAEAAAARKQVNGLLAQLAKPGGADLTSSLLAYPGDARDLLYRLGTASKLTETSKDLYARAIQGMNTVAKLTDQAAVAKKEFDRRRAIAQTALEQAQVAAKAAEQAVGTQTARLEETKAQLAALQQNSMTVQAKYQEGVLARAAAAAAAAAARATALVNPSTGWALPARGPITSPFGNRIDPTRGGIAFHSGVDIATPCGSGVWAARAGTVIWAGNYLDLGQYILLDNGNGIQTGYGHNMMGGLLVSVGDRVQAGQQIAKAGSTGRSTGCHSHFLIRINGALTDPVAYLRNQGIKVG